MALIKEEDKAGGRWLCISLYIGWVHTTSYIMFFPINFMFETTDSYQACPTIWLAWKKNPNLIKEMHSGKWSYAQ